MQLILDHVCVQLGRPPTQIVDNVSFGLDRGDIGVLMGPSGCGKTTLIRAIAGLERVSQGRILLQKDTLSSSTQHCSVQNRQFGMVFQDYALFPHLTVTENVAFGLSTWSGSDRRVRVSEVLSQVQLDDLAKRMPHQLSGGQQQRVAVARALAPKPRLLLMDEPFSNLDRTLREHLSLQLRGILKASATTVLVVTHDLEEAFALGDRVGVMNQGRLLQWDRPEVLYQRPYDAFVAAFTGPCSWLRSERVSSQCVETTLGKFNSRVDGEAPVINGLALLRANDVQIDASSSVCATLTHKIFRGDHVLLELRLADDQQLFVQAAGDASYEIGSQLGVRARMDSVIVVPQSMAAQ